MTKPSLISAVLVAELLYGCGGTGALAQGRVADAADPKRSELDAPLAVGSTYRPEVKLDLRGGGVPALVLESPRTHVVSVREGALRAQSPGLTAVLVRMPDGTVIDFLHVWVEAPTRVSLHRYAPDFTELGVVSAPIDLVVSESVLLTPRIYAGVQRLAGNAEATWHVKPPLLTVLRDGVPERRRLVARAPGQATVTVSMLGTSTSIDVRVVR
jgi:hypothetical protein